MAVRVGAATAGMPPQLVLFAPHTLCKAMRHLFHDLCKHTCACCRWPLGSLQCP
jgi:hypothetical protein